MEEEADKYRNYMFGEGEKDTRWRFGAPPKYDLANKLFEEGRTQEWPKGSLEEMVQNAVKSWEMEISHKSRIEDFKSINPHKFRLLVNGRKALSGEEIQAMGSFNALLRSSLPKNLRPYNADEESFESAYNIFYTAFPRGFAWEVLKVYSGHPVLVFKFRHWGYMEGPYKGHAPTGELVEFTGVAVLKVDESLRAEEVEIYYDPGVVFGALLNGPLLAASSDGNDATASIVASSLGSCPFFKQDHA